MIQVGSAGLPKHIIDWLLLYYTAFWPFSPINKLCIPPKWWVIPTRYCTMSLGPSCPKLIWGIFWRPNKYYNHHVHPKWAQSSIYETCYRSLFACKILCLQGSMNSYWDNIAQHLSRFVIYSQPLGSSAIFRCLSIQMTFIQKKISPKFLQLFMESYHMK